MYMYSVYMYIKVSVCSHIAKSTYIYVHICTLGAVKHHVCMGIPLHMPVVL